MKIKCINNRKSFLPKEILDVYRISYDKFFIQEGKEYIVYAIGISYGSVWYCICDEAYMFYPNWTPSHLFEISDNRLSRYWVFNIEKQGDKNLPYLAFPEWANDPFFYGKLLDGDSTDPNALLFKKYKELMDLEFPSLSISEKAQIGDQEWLICPKCFKAWQSESQIDAIVKCPQCQTQLNNPKYINKWPHL